MFDPEITGANTGANTVKPVQTGAQVGHGTPPKAALHLEGWGDDPPTEQWERVWFKLAAPMDPQ